MIAPCTIHIPLRSIPAHIAVYRHGRRIPLRQRHHDTFLQAGDTVRVGRRARLTFVLYGNRTRVGHGEIRIECRSLALDRRLPGAATTLLAVRLDSGRVEVRAGGRTRRALVLTHEMLAFATTAGTNFVVERNAAQSSARAWTRGSTITAALAADQAVRIDDQRSYTAISDRGGLRLDIWPFSISPLQRATSRRDELVPFWADGLPCSVGCSAPGVIRGWPLKPFHEQHAIRAGINELRPANFHVGVDIQANDFQPVYAIQPGIAHWSPTGSRGDYSVTVGTFTYWHLLPTVAQGQPVAAYRTPLGNVLHGFGHIAFSEGPSYLNPLRPGGPLRPYSDTERPIIGRPRIFADGRAILAAFDPQSVVHRQHYETPVLAPASLAWRLYDAGGRALTGLQWAMRGSQHYPTLLKPVIFAPGAANPGFACFYRRVRCIPNWVYWLAGGLTQPLPLARLGPGRYRLTVYAWDWAGNTSARDDWIRVPLVGAADAATEFGPLNPRFDFDETAPPGS